MEKYDEKDGVWRTIGGRKVFIAKGESLRQAMVKSGKFKREDIREGKRELKFEDTNKKNLLEKNYNEKKAQKRINKFHSKYYEKPYREQIINNNFKDNQAEKNRINENGGTLKDEKTRVQRNKLKYSEKDMREIKHEYLQKKLFYARMDKNSGNDDWNGEEEVKKYAKETNKTYEQADKELRRDYRKYLDEKENKIVDFKAKKQSNNKIEKSSNNYDSKTPEQAKAELGWGHHNLTNEKAIEEKFGKQSNNKIENVHDLIEKNIARDKELAKEGRTYNDYMLEQRTNGKFRSFDDLDKEINKQSNNKIQNNNDEFDMRKYSITLQHDKGTKTIETTASSKESAIKSVLKSENAPDSAVKDVKDNGSILNKQSNNKSDLVGLKQEGNTYIPIREGDDERRQSKINFAQDKAKVKELAKDFDREKTGEKVMRGESINAKEYAGYISSGPQPGDVIIGGGRHGEDVVVDKDGKWKPIDDKKNKIKKYVDKKQSNNKVDPYDDPESNESQRLQSIQSRYDEYLQDTENRGASYGEIAYVDSLRGKDLDDFEKELDDYFKKLDNDLKNNQNTYKFGKKKHNSRIEKNFDNYGRVDKEEAINNEIEKTIRKYKKRKGK